MEHKGVGCTGLSFSAQAPPHQMFSPGCILASANPVWDSHTFVHFRCPKIRKHLSQDLVSEGSFHAATHAFGRIPKSIAPSGFQRQRSIRFARSQLACAEGQSNQSVARKRRCSLGMVGKWRGRFLQARLEGLYDEPRPGAPRKVSVPRSSRSSFRPLESTPRGETHWSTGGLAKATGRMTISKGPGRRIGTRT